LEIVQLTNAERAKTGAGALRVDEGLMDIARKRALEIVTDYSHAGKAKYCNCGENIDSNWFTQASAGAFMAEWLGSDTHHQNFLRTEYSRIGVGVYVIKGSWAYAVQIFE
jgi:uncharacterized protein YkwD